MNKSPQNIIKLDVSKLLGYTRQGIVMDGVKPIGAIKPSIGAKPSDVKPLTPPPKPTIGTKPIVG